jgi:hypothetical protein
MWSHYKPPVSPTNLNLDDMFSFLVQEENSLNKSSNTVLDDIYKQFEDLGEQLLCIKGKLVFPNSDWCI